MGKGMGADTLGGLGGRYPCQNVPDCLGSQARSIGLQDLALSRRKGHWRRHVVLVQIVGLPNKSLVCGALTPVGTARERVCVWVCCRCGRGCGWMLTNTALPPPTGPARLVSSRRHRPLPTFPSPFPADSRFHQTQSPPRPRDPEPPGTAKDPPNWVSVAFSSSLVVGFIGLLVTLLPPNPSLTSISPPPVASRLSEALRTTRLQGCLAFGTLS